MTTREYRISPEFNLGKVRQRAATLAARAKAKGLSGGYTITIEQRQMPVISPQGIEVGREMVDYLIIEGEPVAYDGWDFVAVVEYDNGQPVVTGSPWYEGEPVDRSALKPGYCDHCQTVRRRGKTIVVENEAGERKQVGTSCVKDFLGQEVNGAWFSTKDPFAEFDGYTGRGTPMESLWVTMAAAASVIRQKGWTSKAAAEFSDRRSSSSLTSLVMGPRPTGGRGINYEGLLWDELIAGADAEVDYAAAERAFAFGKAMTGDSDYAQNVRAVFATDEPLGKAFFNPDRFGLVVSVVGMMLKAEAEAAEQQRIAETPIVEEEYAEPKTKIEITDAVVARIRGFDTNFGWTEFITLVGDGHRFVWKTGANPGLKEGDRVDFKATVKGRDEYNGQVSTQVLRLKVTKREEVAA